MTTALVISGGGSKGAFAVGALKYMVQQGLAFDIFAGTSTGSLVATMGAIGELALLEHEYTTVRTEDVLGPATLDELDDNGYYFTTIPLYERLKAQVTDARYAALAALPKQTFIATVSLEQGRPVYFQFSGVPGIAPALGGQVVRIPDRPMALRALLASCSEPVFMPTVPIRIPPFIDPGQTFVDGGVLEYSPLQIALANGATDIYLVVHTPLPANRHPVPTANLKGLMGILPRTIGLLTSEVGDDDIRLASLLGGASRYVANCRTRAAAKGVSAADLDEIFAPVNGDADDAAWGHQLPVRLWVIDPPQPFEKEGHQFDPALMLQWLNRGFDRAQEVLAAGATLEFPAFTA